MNSKDWTELLVSVLFSLLSAYLKKHGEDAAQDVISRVSADLAVREPEPVKLSQLAELGHVASFSAFLPSSSADMPLTEKEAFRMRHGHLPT